MTRISSRFTALLLTATCLAPHLALSQELLSTPWQSTPWQADDTPDAAAIMPPGLQSARLLPGWTDAQGDRVMALELVLEPGWKTYWRTPGDTGLPPHFEWEGSQNLSDVTFHWPAPQAIRSGDTLEMGYHDRLVLPFTAHATDATKPIAVETQVDIGLCESICVPAALDLTAGQAAPDPDPVILAALKAEPARIAGHFSCRLTEMDDGMRLSVALPSPDITLAAIELTDQPDIWVSSADLVDKGQGPSAVVEMVGPTGKPFDIDPKALRVTMVTGSEGNSSAVEMSGCDLQD
ncbi:protein-disulfide reductase DsbD domain-containing protein [Paracoccus sp. JM45]|uniref:protein-disulfide reductase DsbD domain-containing protein n=1 Tax=Paracoccus sp. JM45 TaxID=2283626 RepID=UPI001602E7DF|nr:protein-disulfide reductase DsbD domain-containing protein [Paracoccus sp. JM45]